MNKQQSPDSASSEAIDMLREEVRGLTLIINGLCVAIAGNGITSPLGPAVESLASSVSELAEKIRPGD